MKSKKKKTKKKSNFLTRNYKFIIVIAICVIGSAISGYASSALVNSKEVKYDNSTSGLASTNVQDAIVELNNNATDYSTMLNRLNNIGKELYPVGSIFISVSNVNPSTFIGGTWVSFGTGRTLVGVNTSNSNFNTVEKTGGNETTTLAVANIPAHTHTIPALSGTAASAGAHTHSWSGTTSSAGAHTHTTSGTAASAGAHTHSWSGTTSSAGAHTHTYSDNPGLTFRYPVPNGYAYSSAHADVNGSHSDLYDGWWHIADTPVSSGTTGSAGAHTHTVSGTTGSAGAHTHSVSGTAASAGAHTHTVSGTTGSAGAHTHTVSTTASTSGSTGSTSAFSIMDPYITVYMWKRTA